MGKTKKRQPKGSAFRLSDVIGKDSIVKLKARDKEGVIKELVEHLAKTGRVSKGQVKEIVKRILEREKEGSTGIGNSVAIPHIKQFEGVKRMVGVLGCASDGVEFNAVDGGLCRLFFLFITPKEQTEDDLGVLRKVALLARDAELCAYLATVKDARKIRRVLASLDDS